MFLGFVCHAHIAGTEPWLWKYILYCIICARGWCGLTFGDLEKLECSSDPGAAGAAETLCSLRLAFGDKRSAELIASHRAPGVAEESSIFLKNRRDEEIPYL